MQSCHAPKATHPVTGHKPDTSKAIVYNGYEGLRPKSLGTGPYLMSWGSKMRLVSAIFAGVLGITAFGGVPAYAQESSSEVWVNTQWRTPSTRTTRRDVALRRSLAAINRPAEQVSLGFTLTSYTGIVGQLELGRVSLGPDITSENFLTYMYPGTVDTSVDETIGQATISWNVTPRVALSTSYSQDLADGISPEGTPLFEETIGGGVTFDITPQLELSAMTARSSTLDELSYGAPGINSGEAGLGAAYSFMPYLTGSVNYTYRSFDGQVGEFHPDESTLSLSLTGTF